jgi:hypothetical protein
MINSMGIDATFPDRTPCLPASAEIPLLTPLQKGQAPWQMERWSIQRDIIAASASA